MDNDLLTLFSYDGRVSEISSKGVVVYLILRADIISCKGTDRSKVLKSRRMLASGLSIEDISAIAGFSELEVKNCIDELQRKKLVVRNSTYYQLGTYEPFGNPAENGLIPKWYQLETKSQIKEKVPENDRNGINKMRDQIRQMKKRIDSEKRAVGARLAPETKQTLIQNTMKEVKHKFKAKAEKPTKTLFMLFRKLYMRDFKDYAKFATGESVNTNDKQKIKEGWLKTNIYMLRFFKYFNENMEVAQKAIEYTFDNWNDIKKVMNLGAQSELNVGLLTSKWFMEKVKLWQQTGIPTWRLTKQPSKSNERINRSYEPTKADEDFGKDEDAGDTLPGEFG